MMNEMPQTTSPPLTAFSPPAVTLGTPTPASTPTPPPNEPASARADQWKIDVNARYVRLVDLLISLSTGAIVLPPLFLKTYLGVTTEPVAMFLDGYSVASILLFALTLGLGLVYHLISVQWVKHAWGQPTALSMRALERLLRGVLIGMVVGFAGGLLSFTQFIRGS
jgi:hypothetical protein